MTALINDRNTHFKDGINLPFKMAGNTEIFAGSLVVANAAGFAVPGYAATGLVALGRAEAHIANSSTDGTKDVVVLRKKAFLFANLTADPVVQADMGRPCYIADDQTVCHSAAGKSVAGTVVGLEAGNVWVYIG